MNSNLPLVRFKPQKVCADTLIILICGFPS